MKKEYALKMDDNDQLSYLKKEFLYGDGKGRKKIYFCGNSLGLQHYSLKNKINKHCLLYTSPSPRDCKTSRMPSSA